MTNHVQTSHFYLIVIGQVAIAFFATAANGSSPEGTVVLFDGEETNLFVSTTGEAINWPVEGGALVSTPNTRRSNNLVSRFHFRDAEIHVEFMLPHTGDGNSGIYIHGRYELQILSAVDRTQLTASDMGAVYGLHAPLVNAARGPGEWQSLDIRYRAPRRDTSGKLVVDGTITASLNGQTIQDNVKVGQKVSQYNPYEYDTTPYLQAVYTQQKKTGAGPLLLQDHDNPARFRNIWVKPLDEHAAMYELSISESIHHNDSDD